MLHVLSESQKKKVIKEYKMRLVIVICWIIVFISLVGLACLLPSYLSAVGRVNIIKSENQIKERSVQVLKDQNFQDKIKLVNSSLEALKTSINILSPKEAYNKILNSLPEGVYIDRYTYGLIDDNSASISISGVAPDRDKLIELQKKINSNPEFTSINIPITSFTRKKDLSFSFNFNLIKSVKK
jgi:hypothetical protein